MTNQELKNLLISKIKELGTIPQQLEIDGIIYNWSGGQRMGNQQLYRYRQIGVHEIPKEKQILLPC